MALTRVQASAKASAGATTTIAIPMATPPTVGNGLVVIVNAWGSVAPTACTDNQGNTYSVARAQAFSPSNASIFYCAKVATSGAPFTITATTLGAGSYLIGRAVEYSGVGAGLVVDQVIGTGANSSAPATGTTAALTGSESLQVASFASSAAQSTITVVSATPVWTQEFEELPFSFIAGEADSRVVSSAAGTTPSCSWTGTNSSVWAAALVAFKAAGVTDARVTQLVVETLSANVAAAAAAETVQAYVWGPL